MRSIESRCISVVQGSHMNAHPNDTSSDAVQRRAKRRASAEARKADRVKAKAIGREWKLTRKQGKAHARAAACAEYKAEVAEGRKREARSEENTSELTSLMSTP